MPRKILVPVDFSPASLAAVLRAHATADATGGQLHLLYVMPAARPIAQSAQLCGSEVGLLGNTEKLMALHRLATLIVGLGLDPLKTTGVVRMGDVEAAVAQYAAEISADRIVITHSDGEPASCAARSLDADAANNRLANPSLRGRRVASRHGLLGRPAIRASPGVAPTPGESGGPRR